MKNKVLLLERFENGWHGKGVNFSVSYYTNNLEHVIKSHQGNGSKIAEGCILLDKQGLGDNAFDYVFKGPMCDVSLPPNTKPENPRALDFVSLDVHVEAWRKLGAKVGHFNNNQITWEN